MNLKDAILSTITEIQSTQDIPSEAGEAKSKHPFSIKESKKIEVSESEDEGPRFETPAEEEMHSDIIEDRFLYDLRERILVLFEGFQSPNNKNLEAKIDLTLNFLEHLLAQIDQKIDTKKL